MKKLSCAFTGCQPNRFSFGYNEEHEDFSKFKIKLITEIIDLCYQGVEVFYTKMDLGVGIWCAEIALALRDSFKNIELVCVLPFEGHEKKWSSEYQFRYQRLLENCSHKIVISNGKTNNCYQKVNNYIVDYADIVLAVHTDDNNRRKSFVSQAIHTARKKGKKIILIHPDTFETI